MQSDMDFLPEIFDPLVVITVGDVDPEGKLAGVAKELISVDSLDDLDVAVEMARGFIGGERVLVFVCVGVYVRACVRLCVCVSTFVCVLVKCAWG